MPRLVERKEMWNKRGPKGGRAEATPKDGLCRQFNLSEWSLWQDEAHKRHLVTESTSSKILRSTLEGLRYGLLYKGTLGIGIQIGIDSIEVAR